MEKPTAETYGALQRAFDHFNTELFGGRLAPVVFVFLRKPGMRGAFRSAAWKRRGKGGAAGSGGAVDTADEIALNPDYLLDHDAVEVLGTLVHEQVHQFQVLTGTPSRPTYHNAEWADMAEAVGLRPTATGAVGGARVGQKMEHLVEPGGRFEASAERLLAAGWDLCWEARATGSGAAAPEGENAGAEPAVEPPVSSKLAYFCPACGLRAWAKPKTNLMCGDCLRHLKVDID
ncbi:SprT-like domain-containing protein [Phycisphaera mikurensis]|nr:SprT-like domain-containing protein [Phycisphaera mikurensis]MBB6443199.1 hypothetical protein [Phycisphaera mikurensis]